MLRLMDRLLVVVVWVLDRVLDWLWDQGHGTWREE